MLDISLFREVKDDKSTGWQAVIVVALAGLATWIGIGLAGFFKMAGSLSPIVLLVGLISSILLWLSWSLGAWLIGTKVIKHDRTATTFRELLRATGFAVSPGILGIFVFIPVIGWAILLAATLWVFVALTVALKAAVNGGLGRAAVTWAAGCAAVVMVLIATIEISVLSGPFLSSGFTGGFDRRLNSVVQPYRFSIASWELQNLPNDLFNIVGDTGINIGNASNTVVTFFSAGERNQPNLDAVEKIIENQIRATLSDENVTAFPPVNFQLQQMPLLLVISPRDNIESIREILLDPRLSLPQIEDIEKQADSLNVSSLVVDIGGFAASYPTMVSNDSSLRFTLDAAAEEWVHQYLVFKPLGFRYLLDLTGIKRDYEVAQINEGVAGMVSQEIGVALRRRYYEVPSEAVAPDYSEFYREMREIRLAVDDYLSKGQVESAEKFMYQKREELGAKGYNIRKLNQAYFAWHGTYANQPESVSPIGAELQDLRNQCDSVRQFLDIVSEMTSAQDLQNRLAKWQ